MAEEVVLRFNDVTFEYVHKKPLLDEVHFVLHKGSKITLMGQNGAGKSTLFSLIKGLQKPIKGNIFITEGATVASADQVMARENLELSVKDYFAKAFVNVPGDLERKIKLILEIVNLPILLEKKVRDFSGGQQARLLLAFALIQNPDILLLDEPTNNLDQEGIDNLIQFLVMYEKTVLVISHDADFLNCFTEGVLYLDAFTHKIETYVGDYHSVVEEISKRIEREQMKNAQLEKKILDRKKKVNFFANKGGKMRKLARKLKDEIQEMEESKVDVRREDKAIRKFVIPFQDFLGDLVIIDSVKVIKKHQPVIKKIDLHLRKKQHLLVSGPNGIGKSTLLRNLVKDNPEGAKITDGVKVGYYSQDFSNLDLNQTVFDCLNQVLQKGFGEQELRSVAAGFLLTGELMPRKIEALSEGQKGLLSFARLVLLQPGILILDEPTNHINFRHLPIIAKAVNDYQGALIMVSHMTDFVSQIQIDQELKLDEL